MSLEHYRRPRMITLRPSSTAYDAARAMVDNHVGALIVAEAGELVGIVTDRDLASEVMAAGLDPQRTDIADIMSDNVATIDVQATPADALKRMREHACRRLPVMEGGKVVGLITLDDLLLDGAVDAGEVAEVIRAQLQAPARHKRAGAVHPEGRARPDAPQRGGRAMTRRAARAASSYERFLHTVETHSGLTERSKAELAAKVVLGSICRRVTPEEAEHFVAQLPSVLQGALEAHRTGPDRSITRTSIEDELAQVLALPLRRTTDVLIGVCQAITDVTSEGQIEALRGQLPLELKPLFPVRMRRAV